MVMVKTNKNAVRTIPMGPLGDIRTTNMMVNGKRMAEKFSVFRTFHNSWYGVRGSSIHSYTSEGGQETLVKPWLSVLMIQRHIYQADLVPKIGYFV